MKSDNIKLNLNVEMEGSLIEKVEEMGPYNQYYNWCHNYRDVLFSISWHARDKRNGYY